MEKNNKIIDKKIVVYSHDAGGAQILSSYLCSKKVNKVYGVCAGPALKIFKEKNIKIKKISIDKSIKIGDHFFTTTSWKSNLEKIAMKKLLKNKIKFITFIDHWVHFKKRFNPRYLPEEIWTFDSRSYTICKKIFKKVNVRLKKNYFHTFAIKKISNYKKPTKYKLNYLYLTEPLSNLYLKYYQKKIKTTEVDYLNYFLKKCSQKINVTIRIHPNDKLKKYKNIIKKYNSLNIKIDNKTNLYKQLATNFNIVSYQSSLLNLALKNKNRVLCSSINKKFRLHYLKNNNQYIYNYERF